VYHKNVFQGQELLRKQKSLSSYYIAKDWRWPIRVHRSTQSGFITRWPILTD